MRFGFMGGTFDPPHNGHLAVAREAARAFRLDRVWLAPVGKQPLKSAPPVACFDDRLAMVERLCGDDPVLQASAIDAPRGDGPNFTIDTLRRLRATMSAEDQLYVIVGADSFLDLPRWRDPAGLLAAAEWIVVSRPGFDLSRLRDLELTPAERVRIHPLTDVAVPVSATRLRESLRGEEDVSGKVPPAVVDYIRTRGLYRASAG